MQVAACWQLSAACQRKSTPTAFVADRNKRQPPGRMAQSLMAATGRDFSVSDCTAIPPRRVPSSRQRHRQPRLRHRSILCRQRPACSSFNPNSDRLPDRRPNNRPGPAEQAVAFGTEFQHRMSRAMYGNWQQPALRKQHRQQSPMRLPHCTRSAHPFMADPESCGDLSGIPTSCSHTLTAAEDKLGAAPHTPCTPGKSAPRRRVSRLQ